MKEKTDEIVIDERTYQFRHQRNVFLRWPELRHAIDVFEERIVSIRPAKNDAYSVNP